MSAPAVGPGEGVASPVVSLRGLRKEFGTGASRVVAVDGVDLDIAEGEFVTLLGPSGSGKTTVLRMIAGFEAPTAGQVLLRGRDVTASAPFERDVNTVFQDYALFPHMDVLTNVEYGLRVKKVPRAERRERAHEALRGVRLDGLGSRMPGQLSGGQRQRVALARALVNRPSVLLLDEPLGALDLKLREQMQVELKAIQRTVGITFVFVTHDQEEALTMSDRIVVFDRGRIDQVGTATDIYERPATAFVAGFVGTSNLLHPDAAQAVLGERGLFTVRPERIRLLDDGEQAGEGEAVAAAVVREVVYAGATTRLVVRLDAGDDLVVQRQNRRSPTADDAALRGRAVRLAWSRADAYRLGDAPAAVAGPVDP